MALGGSLICRFTALPTLSSPCLSLPYPSPPPPAPKPVMHCFQQPCRVEKPCYTFPMPILSCAQEGQARALSGGALPK